MTPATRQTRRRPFPAAPRRDTVSVRAGGAVCITRKESSPMRTQLVAALVALALVGGTARAANPVVIIETSVGNIKVELNEEKAPITVKNFLKYVDDKHYDGTVFHRVIPTFM